MTSLCDTTCSLVLRLRSLVSCPPAFVVQLVFRPLVFLTPSVIENAQKSWEVLSSTHYGIAQRAKPCIVVFDRFVPFVAVCGLVHAGI